MLSFVIVVVASCRFFLTGHREVADALHITDDTSQIINVLTMAFRALMQIMFADVSAFVADGVRDVEREVVASLLGCYAEKVGVLCL